MALETEPRDWLLDERNDIVITTDLQWSRGIPAIVQSCRIALQMFRGEWFLNLDVGIPYWQDILGQKPAAAVAIAREEFRRELLEVDGVVDVLKLEVTYDGATRNLAVTWQVSTAFGETPVDTLDLEVA